MMKAKLSDSDKKAGSLLQGHGDGHVRLAAISSPDESLLKLTVVKMPPHDLLHSLRSLFVGSWCMGPDHRAEITRSTMSGSAFRRPR
jgi:hypothetical protein